MVQAAIRSMNDISFDDVQERVLLTDRYFGIDDLVNHVRGDVML